MKITKQLLESFDPCPDRWENYLEHYESFEGTELEFLDLDEITGRDKLWVLLRTDFMPKNEHQTQLGFLTTQSSSVNHQVVGKASRKHIVKNFTISSQKKYALRVSMSAKSDKF